MGPAISRGILAIIMESLITMEWVKRGWGGVRKCRHNNISMIMDIFKKLMKKKTFTKPTEQPVFFFLALFSACIFQCHNFRLTRMLLEILKVAYHVPRSSS